METVVSIDLNPLAGTESVTFVSALPYPVLQEFHSIANRLFAGDGQARNLFKLKE